MKYLIDTQILIWWVSDFENLTKKVHKLITDKQNTICISKVSLWEIAIKKNIGKMSLVLEMKELIEEIEHSNMQILDIDNSHIDKYVNLPLHHRDPFDRLLICQSMVEQLPIISSDAAFSKYTVDLIKN